ncbi:transaldolase family protein [Leptolyngbya sp. FACHB-261]|uniref:transaldolase family protein n=1 Tax=Leptolyngbya sp. FACHB-261 TaxID=2692806 RepID=UPI001683869A|nr:transaldolase family protein [Leptolyngbya sp. FACHB-261]MBD2100201.1 transaldolase [Leptolyngbya sp. FACHB-261]
MLSTEPMCLLSHLRRHGQSVWLDGFERGSIIRGRLPQLVAQHDLQGLLLNFTGLEQGLDSPHYDQDFRAMERHPDLDVRALYEYIVIRDAQMAADLLKVVHDQTHRYDGYVNLDLSPECMFDAQRTLSEAQRLWQTVGWSNLMLKIPATPATLSVLELLVGQGMNVNVTLLFSPQVYEQVAQAYLRGLELFAMQGGDLSKVASVVSFSVGRLDESVDTLLRTRLDQASEPQEQELLSSLLGQVATAQAKVIYQRYQALHQSARWQNLATLGGQPQRLLWADIGLDNNQARRWFYLESLLGSGTVVTLSAAAIHEGCNGEQFEAGLNTNLEIAQQTLAQVEQLGLSLEAIADQLLLQGIQQSTTAFEQLLRTVEQKRQLRRLQ